MVLAVGSPEGLQSSITMGVISAVARQADPTKSLNYVQTDAPINPGNSGGPLVDMDGYVVGINTFILSQSGGSEGLGFAIPARVVNFVYHSLRKYGHVHHVEIGAGSAGDHADPGGRPGTAAVLGRHRGRRYARMAPPPPPGCRCRTLFLPPTTVRLRLCRR